jgi:Asp-tRNA(Asn)/Glu-tRNA(Gln) amidotransferase A subunit family amidase
MQPELIDILTSAEAARAAFVSGAASAEEIARAMLARIARENPRLNAYREVLEATALAEARRADIARVAGRDPGPLAGLCVAVKENIDTVPAGASAGMRFLKDRRAAEDSWITARLRALGATIIGTTISDPGAFGVRTAEVIHPVDPVLCVGGSSGGSGAALAAEFCHAAIGTDTGGSIRIPAALCGVAGLKPTFGRLPLSGVWPLVPSLDHVGPMARTREDLLLVLEALVPDLPSRNAPMRVVFDPDWISECDGAVQKNFEETLMLLTRSGIVVSEVRLPVLDRVTAVHGTIFCVETAAFYRGFVASGAELPREGQGAVDHAEAITMPAYLAACSDRQQMREAVDAILEDGALIVSPTTPMATALKNAQHLTVGGKERDFTYGLVRLTCLFDHTGHPAAALPQDGFSLQVVAARNADPATLALSLT